MLLLWWEAQSQAARVREQKRGEQRKVTRREEPLKETILGSRLPSATQVPSGRLEGKPHATAAHCGRRGTSVALIIPASCLPLVGVTLHFWVMSSDPGGDRSQSRIVWTVARCLVQVQKWPEGLGARPQVAGQPRAEPPGGVCRCGRRGGGVRGRQRPMR